MKLFTVHATPRPAGSVPPTGAAGPARPPVLLREGFSLAAALLGPLWFLWRRLWWEAAAMFALTVAAAFLLPEEAGAIAMLAMHLLAGMEGRDRLRARLARRGQPVVAVVLAPDLDLAWFRLAQQRPDLLRGLP